MKFSKFVKRLFRKKGLSEYTADSIIDSLSLDKDKNIQFFIVLRDVESEEIYCKVGIDQVPLGNLFYTFAKEDPALKEVIISVATMLINDNRKEFEDLLSKGVIVPKAKA